MLDNIRLLAEHFPHAVAAGLLIAVVCSLLGMFVILKRVVFIGIVLSEAAALGIAAAMIFHIHAYLGAAVVSMATVAVLAMPFESKRLPRDAVLGVIFVFAASLSILLVSESGFGLHEVRDVQYGDLIFTNATDLLFIIGALMPVLIYFIAFLRPTLYTFLDREAARVSGINVMLWELLFFFALGLVAAAASKVAGALLVFCYLVVAPSAALLLSKRLAVALLLAACLAVASTISGLYLSISQNFPTNQSVAIIMCAAFILALAGAGIRVAFAKAGFAGAVQAPVENKPTAAEQP